MAEQFKNYIAGKWVESGNGKIFSQFNPADIGKVTGVWPAMTREDAQTAISAARDAYPAWRSLPVFKRAEYLKKVHRGLVENREKIAGTITMENGKTLRESLAEIDSAIWEMEFQIHQGLRQFGETAPSAFKDIFAYSKRVPLGVVSIISPWNFPVNVLTRKLTPALMAGNTCVCKPSSLTPQSGFKLLELFIEAGLPDGVLNFVTGSGSVVGSEMTENPLIKAVSFTGSTEVGKGIHVKAAGILARTQLEMGGKNPIIVLADADVEEAVKATVKAAFACAGQWCTATSRAIVDRRVIKEFTRMVLSETKKLRVGPGTEPDTDMGPVCGTQQRDNILRYIEMGKQENAELLCGGGTLSDGILKNGCFIKPTVFAGVKPHMTIAKEEIFGPVLSIIEAEGLDEAIEIANSVDYGLASSIFTEDLSSAFNYLDRIDAGLNHVNLMTALKEPQLSFGGVKFSGMGLPEAGSTGIEFFSDQKVAYIKHRMRSK